jgi:hypothetical protein
LALILGSFVRLGVSSRRYLSISDPPMRQCDRAPRSPWPFRQVSNELAAEGGAIGVELGAGGLTEIVCPQIAASEP